jgi:hypothetical protein
MKARLAVFASVVLLLASSAVRVDAQKPADALDSIDAEWAGIQTDLLEVRRMPDNTVRIRWRWRNTSAKSVHMFSSDEARDALKLNTYLIDPANKKKHLAVTDAGGKVIGTALGYLDLDAHGAISVWAKFPAPPAGVDKLTVVIARTPPFEDVVLK